MKIVEKTSVYFKYKGELCEVTGIATDKVIFFKKIGAKPCSHCGEIKEFVEVEKSLSFQEDSELIDTLTEKGAE